MPSHTPTTTDLLTVTPGEDAPNTAAASKQTLARMEEAMPPVLSVIAGMVDITGFYMLGNIFTAHITGNLVVASAVAVGGGPINLAQLAAIPAFILVLVLIWLIARFSRLTGPALVRLLLGVQCALLAAVLAVSVALKPATHPHGLIAGTAVMIAVAAMATQYALLRLALPKAVSTAVMTGNLSNAVLSIMDALSNGHPLMSADDGRLKQALRLLAGFVVGCVIAALAMPLMGDWVWALPTALAALVMIRPVFWGGR
ncbi:YoaK family protein [Rhodopseudomonas palustris]|uniref:YoaK family protein n=2 Tax=Rhodopseudomonas palustris TaxID=1076 RepID=UPI000E5B4FD4|nr:DUF1275 family protein [Rhodopseudomonas palustris]QLH71187.1 DUF1275 family protein [Rhodopseudomonas palustris]RIA00973.1 DUF1275 domain-containing protein [Rhodopseudomonas palustris]